MLVNKVASSLGRNLQRRTIMIKSALLCLALSVFYESRGEPIEGQYAVAEVVLDRVSDRNLSVCEVIYEKNQFLNANKWKIPNENNKDWQKSLLVASNSLTKKTNYTHNSKFFKVKKLKKRGKSIIIGNHAFY